MTATLTAKDRAAIVKQIERELSGNTNGKRGRIYTTVEEIPISSIMVSETTQRKTNPRRVAKMVKDFHRLAIGTPDVSRRKNGDHYVIDGGHRVAVLREVGLGDESLECKIYHGLTMAEEAALFLQFAARTNVNTFDQFRISLAAMDEVASAINAVAESLGLKVENGPGRGHIQAVKALYAVYNGDGSKGQGGRYHHVLRDALKVLKAAFGDDASSFDGDLIRAVGTLLHHTKGEIDLDRMATKLARSGGPAQVIGLGENERRTLGGAKAKGTAEAIRKMYNSGLRSKTIPPLFK